MEFITEISVIVQKAQNHMKYKKKEDRGMVRPSELESPTSTMSRWRSNQLS